jgi:tRNA threonylcarbamoyladenosine biosynthesis protein TsaB
MIPSDCDPTAAALLAIETAGSNCSVAVAQGAAVLAAERLALRHGHAEALFPMITRVMAAAGLAASQLAAVAVTIGPGGFTGIRVGLAAAHGIALAVGARLVGVTGFAAVAASLGATGDHSGSLLVALDSRRDDLYVQLFAADRTTPLAAPAAVLPNRLGDYVAGFAGDAALLVAGDAAEAAAAALDRHRRIAVAGGSAPDAQGVIAAVRRQTTRHAVSEPVQPLYLRPPDVSLPRRQPALRRTAAS